MFVIGGNINVQAQVTDSKGNVNSSTPSYTLLEPLPCIPTADKPCEKATIDSVTFQDYVQYAFDLAIAVAAFAAVFMIIWGGFQYMSTDAWEQKSEGIKKLKNAVLGLLLILSSYLILKTIDPRLVNIPTSFVKPLVLNYDNSGSDFISRLNGQINSFISQQQQTVAAELDQEKNAVIDLQNKLKQDQANGADAITLARDQNKLNEAVSNVAVSSYNLTILNLRPDMGLGAFLQTEKDAYNSSIQEIAKNGGSNPAAVKALYDTDAQIQQLIKTQISNPNLTPAIASSTIQSAQSITRGLLQNFKAQQ